MTADQKFGLILTVLALLGGLFAWGMRILWHAATLLQADRDATQANTRAIDKLTGAVENLSGRVARLEGPVRRR